MTRSRRLVPLWLVLVLTATACTGDSARERGAKGLLEWQQDARCRRGPADSDLCSEHFVSLLDLIANPKHFQGKIVLVSGYLVMEFEGTALYLDENSYLEGLTKNSVALGRFAPRGTEPLERGEQHLCYATLRGTYTGHRGGHMGLFSGTLDEINLAMRIGRKQCTPVHAR